VHRAGGHVVTSQKDGAGEGIPPRFLVKRHVAQFLVNSQCFIPHTEFLKGVRMWHLGRKCSRAGPSPALHRDVTRDRRERVRPVAGPGMEMGTWCCCPAPWGIWPSFAGGRGSCCPQHISSMPASWCGRAPSLLLRPRRARLVLGEGG